MTSEIKSKTHKFYETTDFDNAICLTGYGKFHIELILACAICIITVGFQNGLSSYVFPAAQYELKLTSYDIGNLNVYFLVGGIASGFLWGILADLTGRRKVLIVTHLLNGILILFCATNPCKISLEICRFFNGFLVGAPGSIIFSYLAEFQPPKYRGTVVCYCGLFFTSAWLLLPIAAYYVLPLNVNFRLGSFFVLNSWRLFFIILALPEIIVGLWFIKLPESPKYYMAMENPKDALDVLKRIYSENTGKRKDNFPVKSLTSEIKQDSNEITCNGKTARILKKMICQIKGLFSPSFIMITVLTCAVMFANMFGVFGLGLWLPELFMRFQKYEELYPNNTVTVKELAQLQITPSHNSTTQLFDAQVFKNTLAMAICSLIYNAISGYLASKVSLKLIPLVSMLLGGISSFSIFWLTSSFQNLVVSCIFQASMVTANMAIGSIGVELFPTSMGGIAICLIMMTGRIGAMCSNLVFGYFMDRHCEVPIFVVAIVVLFGAFLCILIPNKDKKEDYISSKVPISVISK